MCCKCGKLASLIYFSCLEIASHHRIGLAPAILHSPEVLIIKDCLYPSNKIYLAQFLFNFLTESDLTLLADADHVLAQAGGEDSAHMTSDPAQDLVTRLVEEVDTDRTLGELPPSSPHPLKHQSGDLFLRNEFNISLIIDWS